VNIDIRKKGGTKIKPTIWSKIISWKTVMSKNNMTTYKLKVNKNHEDISKQSGMKGIRENTC
jgi:hypothetical protein